MRRNISEQKRVFQKKKKEKLDILDQEHIKDTYKTDLQRIKFFDH